LGVTGTTTLRVLNATSATFSGTLGVTGTSVFAGLTSVANATTATATNTGALTVVGGVGIGGDLRVGGIIYGTFNGSITGNATTATNLAGGTAGQVPFQTAPGVTSFYGPGTAGNVLVSNGSSAPTYNNTLTLTGATEATSTATGALQVRGGTSIVRDLVVGNKITGLLKSGELLSVGDIADGVDKYISIKSLFGTMQIGRNTNTNAYIDSGMGVGTFDLRHNSFAMIQLTNAEEVILPRPTAAVSTSTGALRVAGGAGIGRSLFVQESIVQVGGTYSTLAATYNLINTTATTVNFAGAATALTIGATTGSTTVRNNLSVTGNLTVQGTTTIVDSTVTNIADPIITLGGGAGNTNPIADDNKDRGIAFKWVNNGGTTSTGFFGYDDSTGYLTYIQTATITNEVVSGTKGAVDANLAGGTAMSLHYQSAVDTTAFLPAGTAGFILQTNGTGSAPSWVAASGVSAGSATNADNIRTIERTTNASHFLTFVDSNNATNAYESVYTTSSFVVNPSTGNMGVGSSPSNAKIQVGGSYVAHFGEGTGGAGIDFRNRLTALTTSGTVATIAWLESSSGFSAGSLLLSARPAIGSIVLSATGAADMTIAPATGVVTVSTTTTATSTSTGALQVRGGVGIGGTLYVDRGSIIGNETFAPWGPIYRALQVGKTSALYGVNSGFGGNTTLSDNVYITSGGTSTYLVSNYATKYSQNLSAGIHAWYTATSGTAGNAITFVEAMRITESGGLGFGAAGAFGSAGQVLQSNGNAPPTWVTITPGGGTSTQVNTVLQVGNAIYYPTFVDSNNATATPESVYTTSSFSINPSTGAVVFVSTVAATSTNTGALQVVNGGAGIGGSVYVGGDIFTRGTRVIPLNIQEFVATAGQITFTISGGYTVGTVQVFANGINLDSVDFAASNGTTVVVAEPRAVNDRIKIVSGGTSSAVNNMQNFSIAMSVALSM
jgi:hypothetical protein